MRRVDPRVLCRSPRMMRLATHVSQPLGAAGHQKPVHAACAHQEESLLTKFELLLFSVLYTSRDSPGDVKSACH